MRKITVLLTVDMLLISISIWASYLFRFEGNIPSSYLMQCLTFCIVSVITCIVSMYGFHLYNRIWQYASIIEMTAIVRAVLISCAISLLFTFFISGSYVPLSVTLLSFETMLLTLGGIRFAWRAYRSLLVRNKKNKNRALIIGAGDCGTLVARKLLASEEAAMLPVAFVDDDPAKQKREVCGLPVLGNRSIVQEAIRTHRIDDIIIAIPTASKREVANLLEICKPTGVKVKIIPRIEDLIHGKVSINEIRNVDVDDLLGRDPVKVDLQGIANYVEGKTVLVTGAGGSIGSELCRQIALYRPQKLLMLGHGENSIYAIEMEMKRQFPQQQVESVIADVQDLKRMESVFKKYAPQVVFHAAAHKHVPLMEGNPSEAIKNNVLGTKHVADCADQFGAERFVLISTDKAVNPTSVMGATKRIAEMYIQCLDKTSKTIFAAVRFGNVLGSRGSVIPRFKEQIAMGGPVTVTHPEMIRYFMTIPEAVQLVIQAGAYAKGGEVFILDMGKPVKIVDLAEDLIRLSGFQPYTDIGIEFSGIRPGEKLFEELLTNEEGIGSTKHDRIFIGQPVNINRAELDFEMKKLEKVVGEDNAIIRELLKHIVPTFQNVS
ncbi:polysaccharide biosynthesis protein [Paenibacillus contaminans]